MGSPPLKLDRGGGARSTVDGVTSDVCEADFLFFCRYNSYAETVPALGDADFGETELFGEVVLAAAAATLGEIDLAGAAAAGTPRNEADPVAATGEMGAATGAAMTTSIDAKS